MTLKDFIKDKLYERYNGKTIKGWCEGDGIMFVVYKISVDDGWGGDPPIEITMESKHCFEVGEKWGEWQRVNNPLGGTLCPPDLEKEFRDAHKESFNVSSMDDELPMIIK